MVKIKKLSRQDKNGVRQASDIERKYKLGQIDYTAEEIEALKKQIITDDRLSVTSTNPVQNRVITLALNDKVNKETGKGLSSNDFTDTLANKLNNIPTNAEENIIESITVNGTAQAVTNKNVNIQINNNFTEDYQDQVEANTKARHTHSNKTVLDKITEDSIKRWGSIAFYETGGATDVNTTTEELVLSSTNTPDTGFWYVRTMFYDSKSATSNRTQIAYGYNSNKPIMTRYYASGAWSNWTSSEIISSSIADYEGYVWYANGTLEQWGRVSITPTAANTVTNLTVTFLRAYNNVPDIDAIPQIATPNAVTWSIGGGSTTDESKKGMVIYLTRTNTSATWFRWRAKGYKNPF